MTTLDCSIGRLLRHARLPAAGLAVVALAPAATAQFNNQWLTLVQSTSKLKNPDLTTNADIVSNGDEKDFAVADIDQDGWPDVACGKKIQVSFVGPREGRLFMNYKGVLVDRTQ